MFMDESLPVGVLDDSESDALWVQCLSDCGPKAFVAWALYRIDHESKPRLSPVDQATTNNA